MAEYGYLEGETAPMLMSLEDFGGSSTEWTGGDQTYVSVRWTSSGGITESGNWAMFDEEDQISRILNDTASSIEDRRDRINGIIYTIVTDLLNPTSEDDTRWSSFSFNYRNCCRIGG